VARKPARIEEINIRLDRNLLPEELNPNPSQVRRWFTRNVLQGVWGIFFGWQGEKPIALKARSDGVLVVADVGAGFETYEVFIGTALDNYDVSMTFEPKEKGARWDILIKSYDAVISFKDKTGLQWLPDMEMPVGFHSIDFVSSSIRIKNKTAGNNADFEIVVYY